MTQMRPFRYPVLFVLLLTALFVTSCGSSTTQDASSDSEQAAASTATKTPLPPPAAEESGQDAYPVAAPVIAGDEAAAESDAYPAPDQVPAPAESAYPAEAAEAVAGGVRTYVIVPDESSASYLVDEEFFEDALSKLGIEAGDNFVEGTTPGLTGQIQFDPADPAGTLGETTINADMTLLRTDQDRRDSWIQDNGPTFASFPVATFSAAAISGLPQEIAEGQQVQFQLSGDLTVHEVTQPVTFDVTAVWEGNTLSGTAETRLLMSSFGIEPPSFARTLTVADEFGIRVDLVAREQGG